MYEREREVAIGAVRSASRLCRAVRDGFHAALSQTKDDRSPVTVADYGAQALMIAALHDVFPDDAIVAEEDAELLGAPESERLLSQVVEAVEHERPGVGRNELLDLLGRGGAEGGGSGRFWTMDPIDGTKGFIRGDQYAVALALIEEGKVVLGVLGCPSLSMTGLADQGNANGVIFEAIANRGTAGCHSLSDGHSDIVAVEDDRDLVDAVFCESVERGHTAQSRSSRVAASLGVVAEPVRLDSQCKYAVVARGEADVYLRLPTRADYQEKIWDHAAGALIVETAGGRVSDIDGKALDFSQGRTLSANRGVVATNGKWHDAVIEAIRNASS